eukprot:11263106-Ditylum_brightwellii.AAC.1
MSNFQHFDFASDFKQQSAVTIQSSRWGFLIQYLKEEEIIPFEEWISKLCNDAAIKLQSVACLFLQRSNTSSNETTYQEFALMLELLQSNMKKCLQELKEEEIMPFKEWYLMISQPNTTVDSNKEHQQQHQDHNATVRIQSIFWGYST